MTESEWQTRKQRIDTRLRSMNPPWKIVHFRGRHSWCSNESKPTMNPSPAGTTGTPH